jgi:hypothetical protein
MIRESELGYKLVRPTVIFGTEDILFNNIAYILRRVPVFEIPSSGSYRLRPVAVEDVADICVRSGASEPDEVIHAVGPETLSFEDLVRLIARTLGRRVLFMHVPPTLTLGAPAAIGRVVGDVVVKRDELDGPHGRIGDDGGSGYRHEAPVRVVDAEGRHRGPKLRLGDLMALPPRSSMRFDDLGPKARPFLDQSVRDLLRREHVRVEAWLVPLVGDEVKHLFRRSLYEYLALDVRLVLLSPPFHARCPTGHRPR